MFRVRVKAFEVVLGTIKEETNLNLGGTVTSSYTPSTVTVRYILGERGRDVRKRETEQVYCVLSQPGRVSTVKWCNTQLRTKVR